jgi:hypothetical protein
MLHVLERANGVWSIITTQNTEIARTSPPRFLDPRAAG